MRVLNKKLIGIGITDQNLATKLSGDIMKTHLALVQQTQNVSSAADTNTDQLTDKEAMFYQEVLMEAGSATIKALRLGDTTKMLAGLVSLTYTALQAFATRNHAPIENVGEGYQIYQKLIIMQLLSAKLHNCSSGQLTSYAELYYVCANLASGYLNANFDKAFIAYHEWQQVCQVSKEDCISKRPDLAECLFE